MSSQYILSDKPVPEFIFRAYDIRAKYGEALTEEIAFKIGYCFAKSSIQPGNKQICVGRDGRLSSPALCQKLLMGLHAGGAEIAFLGVVPTPALYFADKKFGAAASIMLTGSHNPKDDNGFKIIQNGAPFFAGKIQQLKDMIADEQWSKLGPFAEDVPFKEIDIMEEYLARITNDINTDSKLKIAFDPANGATCEFVKKLSEILPCEAHIINSEIDGNFPAHPPDPTVPKNMAQLIDFMKNNSCDLGIGFDGDGDRIGVVTASGRVLFGDEILCLFAKDVLATSPGASIIADVKASGVLFDYITQHGGDPIMWKTGHSYIKQKMRESGALLAGEMSGHIFFADKYYGYDDALYAAMRLIDIVSKSDQSLDEMIAKLPKAFNTPEMRIAVDEEKKFKIIEKIADQAKANGVDFIDVDGLRVNKQNGWWLLRASNTQPAIIARCEADTEQGCKEIQLELKSILKKHNVDISKEI